MEILNDIDKINSLLNDVWNFQLIIFGLSMTLFTLLYSFIISKREELKYISNQIKSNQSQPSTFQNELFAKNYINKLKNINKKLLVLIVVSFITSFFGWLVERLVSDCCLVLKRNLMIILLMFTLVIIIGTIFQFKKIYKDYIEDTKI